MKKLLFVVDEKKMGGVSIVLEDILNNIDKKNISIDLLVLHNNGDCFSSLKNVNIIYGTSFFETIDISFTEAIKSKSFKTIIKKIFLVFLLKTGLIEKKIRKERKKILKVKYDVEISFKDGFCTIFTGSGDSLRKINWIHTDYSNNNPAKKYFSTFKRALCNMDKIVAISHDVATKFNDIYHMENKTIVIYNYIYKNKVLQKSKEEILNKNNREGINFLSVGRLHKIKGYDRIIEIFKKLKQEGLLNNITLTIIGDGPEEKRLKQLISDYNLENNVLLIGKKMNPYIYFINADAFILSSYSEGYPLVIIEALILKLPVITVEFSSVYEMLNNTNGFIIKNNNYDLYNEIKTIINNKETINNLKKNLNMHDYNNDNIIKEIENLWKE